jgi:hypothetical protein
VSTTAPAPTAFPSTLPDGIDPDFGNTQEHREALALRVSVAFTRAVQNLKDLKDDIEALWVEFDFLGSRGTIMGCRGKREFCEKRLGRSLRAVQYMLDGGNHKRSAVPVAPSETVSLPAKVEPEVLAPVLEPVVDVTQESLPVSDPVEPVPVEQPIIELKEGMRVRFDGTVYEIGSEMAGFVSGKRLMTPLFWPLLDAPEPDPTPTEPTDGIVVSKDDLKRISQCRRLMKTKHIDVVEAAKTVGLNAKFYGTVVDGELPVGMFTEKQWKKLLEDTGL